MNERNFFISGGRKCKKKFSKILQKIFNKWSNFFDLDSSLCQCLLSALLIVFQFSDLEIRKLFSIYKKKNNYISFPKNIHLRISSYYNIWLLEKSIDIWQYCGFANTCCKKYYEQINYNNFSRLKRIQFSNLRRLNL